jgi:hypothetical protein
VTIELATEGHRHVSGSFEATRLQDRGRGPNIRHTCRTRGAAASGIAQVKVWARKWRALIRPH